MKRRMLDLFCGRFGWGKAFASRGWEVVGVDIKEPDYIPENCDFYQMDILELKNVWHLKNFDFICASPPCEEFSVYGLKMWFPNPKPPETGINLFEHTRRICEDAGIPYIMENVRSAQQFVGKAISHCGPFYLWGNGVPPLLNQGITKGSMLWSAKYRNMKKSQRKREVAEIPPELANCVASYAEALLEQGNERRERLDRTVV